MAVFSDVDVIRSIVGTECRMLRRSRLKEDPEYQLMTSRQLIITCGIEAFKWGSSPVLSLPHFTSTRESRTWFDHRKVDRSVLGSVAFREGSCMLPALYLQ